MFFFLHFSCNSIFQLLNGSYYFLQQIYFILPSLPAPPVVQKLSVHFHLNLVFLISLPVISFIIA
uniref:Uncharacterized protein n=1 Tax=Octopus bimaculoides TaxID=37653 RepID=A0A0L8GID6_OCTBM